MANYPIHQDNHQPEPHPPEEPQTSMMDEVRAFIPLFFKHWWIILPFVAGGILIQSYRISQEPPTYFSSAKLQAQGQVNVQDMLQYQEVIFNFFGTQAEMIMSSDVQRRAREHINQVYPEFSEKGHSVQINASQKESTSILMLTAQGSHAEYTQVYLDAVVQAYLNLRKEQRSQTTEVTYSAIRSEISRVEEDINRLTDEIQRFQSENNVVFIREQATNAGRYLVELNQQMADLKKQLNLIELFDRELKEGDTGDLNELRERNTTLEAITSTNDSYVKTQQQIRATQAEMARLGKFLRPKHPKIKMLQRQLDQLGIVLEEYERQSKQEIRNRKQSITLKIENLRKQIAEWELRSVDLSRRLAEYDRMHGQLERLKSLYDKHLDTLQRIDTGRNIDRELVSVMENATTPQKIVPNKTTRIATGGFVGLGMGIALMVLLLKWNEKVYNTRDLPEKFPFQVAGFIPKVNTRGRVELLQEHDQRFAFIESFRSLRSYLILQMSRELQGGSGQKKIVALTSAIPSEGKSTVSTNLAISLALTENRTLLIDGDLRKGNLHDAFSVPAEPGFAQILKGEEPWWETIVQTSYNNLHFLPRGNVAMSSSELLMSSKCREFFEEITHHYDYIIIDTPPVLATDDMANLIPLVDTMLMVVRAGLSSKKGVQNALEMMTSRNAPVLGYVLNSCENSSGGYYRYNYYGNYGKIE